MELFRRFNLSTTLGGGTGWPPGGGPLPPPFPPPGGPGGPAPDTPEYFNMGDIEDSDNVDTNGDGDDDDADGYSDDDGNAALGDSPVYISDPDRFEANTVPACSSRTYHLVVLEQVRYQSTTHHNSKAVLARIIW